MATTDYVAVTGDDWYQRRRDDAEGEFFRKVADQGPRQGQGGSTRQGIYCFTADGQLLAYKNAGQAPDVMREVLQRALREWQRLPEARRQPGVVKVGEPATRDPQYARTPPPGGLVINVYTRILDRGQDGYRRGACPTEGGEAAARDHLWLTEAERQALIPAEPNKGDRQPVPAAVAERILRFHLIDNTRGEPPMWQRDEIRKHELTLTVQDVTPVALRLRLDGSALLATSPDTAKADRGFDVRLLGTIDYDQTKKKIDRFEVVAVGDHWGEGRYTGGARPGRKPLGIAFELATGKTAADLVPPQGIRDLDIYFGRER